VVTYLDLKLWDRLLEYRGQQCHSWSEGWLTGFKTRYKIKERKYFGKAGSAEVKEE